MSISRENADWLAHLRSSGAARDLAIQDLFAWLQNRLFFYLRGRDDLRQLHDQELQDLSQDFAQESVLVVLQKLDQFQGRSRFTTWAAKIAVHQALGELRRARWRDVSLQAITQDGRFEPEFFRRMASHNPEASAIQQEAIAVVMDVIENELSPRQRRALYARMVLGMPSSMLAEELGLTHNALYKLIHDARKRLKARLHARGLDPEELLASFR